MIIRNSFLILLLSFSGSLSFSQDTTRFKDFEEIEISENRVFKRQGLYDEFEIDKTKNINGFTQLNIFESTMSDEVWFSENTACVNVTLKETEKDTYLNLNWNKDQEDCDWVGIGFGWDFWSSKDISGIIDEAAIEFEVRSTNKNITNLPWAMGFEDYAGGQAWLGFSKKYFMDDEITKEWSKVQLPLSLFPFEEFDTDPSNIKQIIVQLFASGTVEINRIELVPFEGKLREEIVASPISNSFVAVDGDLREWNTMFTGFGEKGHTFATKFNSDSLYVAIKVKDESPRLNNKTGGDLWNGDAIEIAIATNPNANPKRNLFLLSDYHFGLNCGSNPYLWNFSDDELYSDGNFAIVQNEEGYFVEIAIPLKKLTNSKLISNMSLGFEIAIDEGSDKMIREVQTIWNGQGVTGFHNNPSLWGIIVFE